MIKCLLGLELELRECEGRASVFSNSQETTTVEEAAFLFLVVVVGLLAGPGDISDWLAAALGALGALASASAALSALAALLSAPTAFLVAASFFLYSTPVKCSSSTYQSLLCLISGFVFVHT